MTTREGMLKAAEICDDRARGSTYAQMAIAFVAEAIRRAAAELPDEPDNAAARIEALEKALKLAEMQLTHLTWPDHIREQCPLCVARAALEGK